MKTFTIKTFGCKTNQYESEGIREALALSGWVEVRNDQSATIAIINTCTVTSRAGASARNAIRKLKKDNPHIRIILTGCAVDVKEDWLAGLDIEAQFTNTEKHLINDYLQGIFISDAATGEGFEFSLKSFAGHTRAFLKIQDGCDNFCSYCIIPYARGKPRSRDIEDIIVEATQLGTNGYHEIVLTGISIGAYNFHNNTLSDLLKRLAQIEKIARIRLGSIEPIHLTEELLYTIANTDKVCTHLHLPLQSGSDTVLKAMNRKYTKNDYFQHIANARKILQNPAITTDIIVGFPTEDEINFQETLKTIKEIGFARSHIFLFSPRSGTPAASMKSPPQRDADKRRLILEELAKAQAAAYSKSLIGFQGEKVMVERIDSSYAHGYLERYIRCKVFITKEIQITKGQLLPVRIEDLQKSKALHNQSTENILKCTAQKDPTP